jgi:hypothetical protein
MFERLAFGGFYLQPMDGPNLARWISDRLPAGLPWSSVVVRETCTSGCTYDGGA